MLAVAGPTLFIGILTALCLLASGVHMFFELIIGSLVSMQPMLEGEHPGRRYVDKSGTVTLSSGEPMQVTCIGEGGPTAILLTGSGGWSIKWAPMHEEMARETRACTIDRPGWGMSGVGRGLTSSDMIKDYREALNLAGEEGPFIIVGHSQGGIEAVFWGEQHSEEIAGLVLVDPGMLDLAKRMSSSAPVLFTEMKAALSGFANYFRSCADRLEAMRSNTQSDGIDDCMPRSEDAVVAAALATVAKDPARFRYNADEIENQLNPDADLGQFSENLGTIPMVVLQATVRRPPARLSEEAQAQSKLVDVQIEAYQERLVGFSKSAELRRVEGAGHDILTDRPDEIIEALREIVTRMRSSG